MADGCVSFVTVQSVVWRILNRNHLFPSSFFQLIGDEMMLTAVIQMKGVCDHRSESQFKQL